MFLVPWLELSGCQQGGSRTCALENEDTLHPGVRLLLRFLFCAWALLHAGKLFFNEIEVFKRRYLSTNNTLDLYPLIFSLLGAVYTLKSKEMTSPVVVNPIGRHTASVSRQRIFISKTKNCRYLRTTFLALIMH